MKAIEKTIVGLKETAKVAQGYSTYNRIDYLREEVSAELTANHDWEADLIHDLSIDLANDLANMVQFPIISEIKKILVGRLTEYVL